VLARFPDQAQNALIKLSWLERARRRAEIQVSDDGLRLVAGVDVGGGEAETVVYVCERKRDLCRIVAMGAWRGEDTRGQVVGFLNRFREHLAVVRVDSIGIGHNFALHLKDQRFRVDMINVALPCESKPHLGVNDPDQRFVNQKALFYQGLADALERDQVVGLTDEETIGQLSGILSETDPQGRMKIESKEKARKRGAPSPDRAEALMLALSKPPPEYAYRSVRDIRRSRGEDTETSGLPFNMGFKEIGDDDGSDELPDSRSWRYRRGFGKW
jgi:hypothetical protein